jgi:glycosyltransferase involved in cell wall biosynthesis
MDPTSSSIITIGMPLFNAETFLGDSLNSLLSQSQGDFQLIISDNASTDGTEAICRSYAKADSRIAYYRQPTNEGASTNFQFVLDAADTPFFMWAAGDDLWAPNYIETCIARLQSDSGLALVASLVVPFIDSIYSAPMYNLSSLPARTPWETRRNYMAQPEELGKANLIYGVYRTNLCKAVAHKAPMGLESRWGADMSFVYSCLSLGNLDIIEQPLFFKRQPPAQINLLANDRLSHAGHEQIARQELSSSWKHYHAYYLSYILSEARDRNTPLRWRLKLMGLAFMLLWKRLWPPAYRLASMTIRHRSDTIRMHASGLRKRFHRGLGI